MNVFSLYYNNSFIVKLFRPIKLYKNWIDVYRSYLRIYPHKELTYFLRNGVRFVSKTASRDHTVLDETWGANLYLQKGIQIGPRDTVVDIGAYIGDFTVFAAKAAHLGKVIAFEPYQANYAFLKRNLTLNGCDNVVAYKSAVSSKNEKLTMYIPKNVEFGSSLLDISKDNDCDKVVVDSYNLHKIIKDNKISKIDLLKIDCEGGEYEILLNLPKEIFSKIKQISLEYHHMQGHKVSELVTLLKLSRFTVYLEEQNKYTGILYAIHKT